MTDDYNGLEWIGLVTLLVLTTAVIGFAIYGFGCLVGGGC